MSTLPEYCIETRQPLLSEAKEPAFLRKLKGQYGGTSRGLERPAARPRKMKDQRADDDDDGPTYVDAESNEVISKEDYESMVRGEAAADGGGKHSVGQSGAPPAPTGKTKDELEEGRTETGAPSQNVAEIGALRKRKQGKLIGEEERAESDLASAQTAASASRKAKPKKKKIKLSFDET